MERIGIFVLTLLFVGVIGISNTPYLYASTEEVYEEERSFNVEEGYEGEQPVIEEEVPFGEEEPFQSEYQTSDEDENLKGEFEEDVQYLEEQETAEHLR